MTGAADSGRRTGDDAGEPETLEVVPTPVRAAGWAVAGLVLVTLGAWIVADSRGHPLAVAALVAFVLVASFFVLQLAVPPLFRVELGPEGVDARVLWRRVRLPWDAIRRAWVTRRLGEHWLVLEVRVSRDSPGSGSARPARTRRVGLLLPVGAELSALRGWLDAWLGVAR